MAADSAISRDCVDEHERLDAAINGEQLRDPGAATVAGDGEPLDAERAQ